MGVKEQIIANGARVVWCDTWQDFMLAVRIGPPPSQVSQFPGYTRIFRGHRDPDWKLASLWERFLSWKIENGQALVPQDRSMRDQKLAAFKQSAAGLRDFRSADLHDDLDWWSLGRHFGLVTPLLDWSRSPYVAAFFAFMDRLLSRNPDVALWVGSMNWETGKEHYEPIAVWELDITDDLPVAGEFEVVTNRIDYAHRQKAQQGVFTMLTHEGTVNVESYLLSRNKSALLTKYLIPSGFRNTPKALADLAMMNVRYDTLFPDLEGAARHANMDFNLSFWSGLLQMTERDDYPPEQTIPKDAKQ